MGNERFTRKKKKEKKVGFIFLQQKNSTADINGLELARSSLKQTQTQNLQGLMG